MATTRKMARPAKARRRSRAVTKEILGNADGQPKINPKWQRHYKRLAELRDFLLNRRGDLVQTAKEDQPNYSLHMADAGTDEYDRNFALSMVSSEQNALYEIEQALNRIRRDTYGTCEVTGKRIELARLNAIPWTRFSAEAERELEKEHAVALPQLAGRERVVEVNPAKESSEEEEE
jgi:RNA polymerase-binding transcription factor DksA